MCRRAEMSDVLHAIIVNNGTTGYSVENILRRMKARFFFFATHSRFESRPR